MVEAVRDVVTEKTNMSPDRSPLTLIPTAQPLMVTSQGVEIDLDLSASSLTV